MQGLAEPDFRWMAVGENSWISFWGLVLLLSILVFYLLVNTWIHIRRVHRHRSRRPSCPAVHFPSLGPARWVGGQRWRLSRRCHSPKRMSFYFTFGLFRVTEPCSSFRSIVCIFCVVLSMRVAKREPTPGYCDAYSVGTLNGHIG